MYKELLEQGNDHVVEVNKLMSKIEERDNILTKISAEDVDICMGNRKESTTWLARALTTDQMIGIKLEIINTIQKNLASTIADYKSLIGVRKPATLNPEFEQAIKEMEKPKPKPTVKEIIQEIKKVEEAKKPELTVELVRSLYIEQDMTLDKVAAELGIGRTTLYNFIDKNGLRKPSKKERELYRDAKVKKETP